jgi:hypothetical protein
LASHQRLASRLGRFSNFRLAFNSARFLISALIFSIKIIASGVRILRVEFTCAPSQKLGVQQANPIPKEGNQKAAAAASPPATERTWEQKTRALRPARNHGSPPPDAGIDLR